MPNDGPTPPCNRSEKEAKKILWKRKTKRFLKWNWNQKDTLCLIKQTASDIFAVYPEAWLDIWNTFAKEQRQPLWEKVN